MKRSIIINQSSKIGKFLTASFVLVTCLCIFGSISLKAASIPQQINYQGKLLKDGQPVTASKNINFSISESNWSEMHENVEIVSGLYSVVIGSIHPLPISIFDGNAKQLSISIDGVRMEPEIELISVAYAFKAAESDNAHKIAGYPVSGEPAKNQVLKWNGSAWTPQSDDTYQVNHNIALNGNYLSNDGGSKGITISDNGDVSIGNTESPGNLNVSGNVNINKALNTVNTNGLSFLNGYIKGCQLTWFSDSQVRINKGLIECGGTLYKIKNFLRLDVEKNTTEAGMYAIYIDSSSIDHQYIEDKDLYFNLNNMPEWNDEKLGWYHPLDTSDRCIGFFYETQKDGIVPFDYIDGDYLYRISFDYGQLAEDTTTDMKLTHVPSSARLAIGMAYINAYKNGSCFLYTHPFLASKNTTRIAHKQFDTDQATDDGGQSTSIRTPVVANKSGAMFSYYFDVHHVNDGGYYFLNGFHWRPDSN